MRSRTRLGGRLRHLVDDAAVCEEHDPVGVDRRRRVVSDHHDRLAEIRHRSPEKVQDLAAGPRVKVAGRLVGENDLRCRRQRPGRRHPLLLAARQLGRAEPEPVLQSDGIDDRVHPWPVGATAGEGGRKGDVLGRGKGRNQIERLEDEADPVPPQLGQVLVVETAEVGVTDQDPSRGQGVQPGQAVHQGGLARTRPSHDGGELTLGEGHVDVVERLHSGLTGPVHLHGIDSLRRRRGASVARPCPATSPGRSVPRPVRSIETASFTAGRTGTDEDGRRDSSRRHCRRRRRPTLPPGGGVHEP